MACQSAPVWWRCCHPLRYMCVCVCVCLLMMSFGFESHKYMYYIPHLTDHSIEPRWYGCVVKHTLRPVGRP
jgi:hypothetical protein